GVPREKETRQNLTLLSLPTLETLRTLSVPDRDIRLAALSPDGTRIACNAPKIGDYTGGPLLLLDSASGQELARQKIPHPTGLAFTLDSRTLLIGLRGMVTGDALQMWNPLP